jgi:PAS domain-containing protein
VLARRTRLRKKFFFESLQADAAALRRENAALRERALRELPAAQAAELLREEPGGAEGGVYTAEASVSPADSGLVRAMQGHQRAFVVTDPALPNNPIVFASQDFCEMTGYGRGEIVGRNCRFLQGPASSIAKVAELRGGVATGKDVSVVIKVSQRQLRPARA